MIYLNLISDYIYLFYFRGHKYFLHRDNPDIYTFDGKNFGKIKIPFESLCRNIELITAAYDSKNSPIQHVSGLLK